MALDTTAQAPGRTADVTTPGASPADPVTTSLIFVLVVTYTAPLTAVDAVMPAHRHFLDEHFATGEFLASGPLDPRTGGVILARVRSADRVAELIAADPFTRRGLAAYEVHAFAPTRGPFAPLLRDGADDPDALAAGGSQARRSVVRQVGASLPVEISVRPTLPS